MTPFRKNILIFGVVAGIILSINMFVMVSMYDPQKPDFSNGEVVGYASMVVVFSLIFFGIRNYRNKYSGGVITFGKAFTLGAWIAFIASSFYVVSWLIAYYNFFPNFMSEYSSFVLNQMAQNGASEAEIAAKTQEMDKFKELYKNPLYVILFTYFEGLPLGLFIALISALILRKKTPNRNEVSPNFQE